MRLVDESHGRWRDGSMFTICGLYIQSAQPIMAGLRRMTCPFCTSVYQDWERTYTRIRLKRSVGAASAALRSLNTGVMELTLKFLKSRRAFDKLYHIMRGC